MNEELQKQLANVIGQVAAGVKQAKDFTVEQVGDVAVQYVAYGRVIEPIALVLLIIFCVASAWIAAKLLRADVSSADSGIGGFIMAALSVLSAIGALVKLRSVVLVYAAPKVWLLLELGKLLK